MNLGCPTSPGSASFSDQPLRVLNDELRERIRAVNRVLAVMQRAGYRVRRQDLRARGRPLIELAGGDAHLARLFTVVRSARNNGRLLRCGRLQGVDIQWPQGDGA